MKNKNIEFFQLFEHESSTYTYLLVDKKTREAVIIDPVIETVERDLQLLSELNAKLKYVLDTHVHADHITAAGKIREKTGAKTVVSRAAQVECVDVPADDKDVLKFGEHSIQILQTPGHTDGCLSFLIDDAVFTGDSLMIRANGRTDFQQGSSETLYHSITEKLFSLPDETLVYPGHDYRGQTVTTIGLEKKYNPRIGGGRTLQEFVKIMSELKLANPKKIHQAVPANLLCGKVKNNLLFQPQNVDGIPEITVQTLHEQFQNANMIDVRRPDEWVGEYGHIEGAKMVTMGPELEAYLATLDKEKEYVFVCRSGARSGNVTHYCLQQGFKHVINMQGGMIAWNQHGFPVTREMK